jgi:hypothetical protein
MVESRTITQLAPQVVNDAQSRARPIRRQGSTAKCAVLAVASATAFAGAMCET